MEQPILALSIRQPWVDLILRGIKRIEVREWPVPQRGLFAIHASWTIDWRSAELFGYEDILSLPRGGLVGTAEVTDCITLDPAAWLDHVADHRVLHARRSRQYGAVLANPRPFSRLIKCGGRPRFFDLPPQIALKVASQLRAG